MIRIARRLLPALLALAPVFLFGQGIKTPAASPQQTIRQDVGLSAIEITYSRPAMKGRKIFGDLVPMGKLWRTGANAATKIKFGEDVLVEGTPVKAGEYALYSIPGEKQWEIILNKGINNWGIGGYKEEDDVARFKVSPKKSAATFENFTIWLDNVSGPSATVFIAWENTLVQFGVSAEIDTKIMTQIQDVMSQDKRPYFQAASYYYENDKDMKQALDWINKAIDQNPTAFWVVHLKAKIQAKLGDKRGAIQTANESIKLAQAAGSDDYVALNLKLIDSLEKGK
jgi:tetratricopeptide (TPR) repeat protein